MHFFTQLILIISFFVAVNSCSCRAPTQQDSYCKASWVSYARIWDKKCIGNFVEYTVIHFAVFKRQTVRLPQRVITATTTENCGEPNLEVGRDYLLAGTKRDCKTLQLSLCLYIPGNDRRPSGVLPWTRIPLDLHHKLMRRDFESCSANNYITRARCSFKKLTV